MEPEWIIPFKGRGHTGVYRQNLLWRSGNLFVMDNHRAAAWCWIHAMPNPGDHLLVHIDRHNDTLRSQLREWMVALPNGIPTEIADYLSATYPSPFSGTSQLFRWDNYLSIYLELVGGRIPELLLATHGEGDRPNHPKIIDLSPTDLLTSLESRVAKRGLPAILNLDLDYFFEPGLDEEAVRLLDDHYVDALASVIARLDASGHLPVITIALTATDDLTAGWQPVEEIAQRVCAVLGHRFALPLPTD
jgi:hypothetical protein